MYDSESIGHDRNISCQGAARIKSNPQVAAARRSNLGRQSQRRDLLRNGMRALSTVVGGQRRQDMSATETKGKALITGALLSSNSGFQRFSPMDALVPSFRVR
jgi:hypothetical protein